MFSTVNIRASTAVRLDVARCSWSAKARMGDESKNELAFCEDECLQRCALLAEKEDGGEQKNHKQNIKIKQRQRCFNSGMLAWRWATV